MNMQVKDLQQNYDHWHKKIYQTDLKKIKKATYRFYNWILKLLKTETNKKILDVACGKGLFLKVAKSKNLDIYGMDISQVAIEKAKKHITGSWLCGDCEKLPYNNETFDYVTCLGSLEHFPQPEKGAKEIARVLKKDGTACIYVPNKFFLGHILMTALYGIEPTEGQQNFSEIFHTSKGWQELLEKNDLKVINVYKYNNIGGTKKVNRIIIYIWNYLIKPFIPFNLSYSFAFILKKKNNHEF